MTAPRIVTLAQLALMPLGTEISPLVITDGAVEFSVQGIVSMKPKARLTGKSHLFLTLTDDLPDVYIEGGRVVTRPSEMDYWLPAIYPHRFVVWSVPKELMP